MSLFYLFYGRSLTGEYNAIDLLYILKYERE
jgi:hypothetical protein